MRRFVSLILAFVTAFAVFFTGITAFTDKGALAAPDPLYHVRIKLISMGDKKSISVFTNGDYSLTQTNYNLRNSAITLDIFDGQIKVSKDGKELYSGAQVSIARTTESASAGYITLSNNRKYLGSFDFYYEDGYIISVNTVPMAYYLYGVLEGEVSNSYPMDALKAQAISAKCYAINKIKANSNYDLRDTSVDQVYKGYYPDSKNIMQAVNATIDEALTYDDKIITAYYTCTNGGETSLPNDNWGGNESMNNGFAIALDDYDFNNSASPKEALTITKGDASEANENLKTMLCDLAKKTLSAETVSLEKINSVELNTPKYKGTQRNMTIAAFNVSVTANNEQKTLNISMPVSAFETYNVFTDDRLCAYWGKSDGNSYTIYHVRHGHGVGLSQRGAQSRALDGKTYKEILGFYYPTASITEMNVYIPDEAPLRPGAPFDASTSFVPGSFSNVRNTPASPECTAVVKPDSDAKKAPTNTYISTANACGYINASEVNLRKGPGTGYDIVATLALYTEVFIFNAKSASWYQIQTNNIVGYVRADYVTLEGEDLPTPSSPPTTPTPTPTASPTPTPANDTYYSAKVNDDDVNFRAAASTNSSSLFKLDKNAQLFVWSKSGDWYNVQYGLRYGFMHSDYVTLGSQSSYEAPANKIYAVATVDSSVNFRSYPSTNAELIRTLNKDTAVSIYGYSNDWYYVIVDGDIGYVSAPYITIQSFLPKPENDITFQLPKGIGTGTINADEVKFRSEPSTSSNIITVFPKGAAVTLYSREGSWFGVTYNGVYGYVHSDYVTTGSETPPPETEGIKLTIGSCTANTLNFRAAPSTDSQKLGTLKKDDKFYVIGICGTWYFVLFEGVTGYLTKEYVKIEASGDCELIDVNTSWQSVNAITTDEVNLRMGASVGAEIITKLSSDTKLILLAITPDSWCLVKCGDIFGFVLLQYISVV